VDDAIRAADPKYLMGFTATPFRSVDTESLRLFDSVAYRYTMEQAIREGVLVPYDVVHVPASWGEVLIDDACIRMIREHAPAGAGVVGASTVEDGMAYAERLTSEGIPARCIR
jgi:superfamily II DNA or RNA helicase